ncbi:MAG: hypothetical protein JRF33_26120, partial [Deltaproteobacteria bacterium]|nr:hypothetical protein [Deltaproteobacteria bacterium]
MNFKQKSAIFITLPCLFVFGALPLQATDLSAGPQATTRLLAPRGLASRHKRPYPKGPLIGHDAQLTKFAQTSQRIEQLDSPLAKARLEAEQARYQAFIDHSLPLIEAMSAGVLDSAQSADLRNFIATLEGPEPPIIGSTTLPYQNLAAAQRLPLEEPNITPAYKGGNKDLQPADRQASPTAPLSQAIVNKARELNWNPVNIFDYVYNYVDTEWYHGCMKGAEQTLLQGSGNDSDQAALLVALLRASGYPARFVVGVGRLLDLDRAPLVFGVENTQQVLQLLQRAGIPHAQELSAGKLSNIRFEHVWVAAYLPFTDYRGSAMEEGGELWTSMDTSLKAAGYELNEPPPLPEDLDLTSISENYLQADRPETPLEFLKAEIEVLLDATQADHTYEDLLQTREQKPQHQDILPSGLPFLTALVTSESTSLPERLLHQVKFTAYDAVNPSQVFFDLTLPAHKLSNRSIALRYEPETVEDQEIINSFGGLGATPAYLVRLRPVLTVDGQRLAIGTAGLPMGADARLAIELAGPAGTKRFVNELVVGNLTVMALVAGKPILAEPLALEQKGAERIYFDEALRYLLRWQAAEKELAALLRLHLSHPAPQVVTLGGVVQVNRVLGVPHEFTWKGAFVDADLRQVELVGENAAKKLFMDISGLQGSVLEDRILREDLGVDSISTARLLAIANNQGIPLVTIDAANVDTLLPSLPFGAKVKQDIRDAVQQGQQVLVPDRMLTVGVWTGVGYQRSDPLTGEAGWMLSGLIAGSYTVVDRESWPGPYFMVLAHQLVSAPNYDSSSARAIAKILASDKQEATVGASIQLKVVVVDSDQKPVDGADVFFSVLAGGGSLAQNTVTTNVIGIATATLNLGTSTAENPIYQNGEPWTVQAGLNVVDAYLTTSGTHLKTPFTAIGMPDKKKARLVNLTTATLGGRVMSWGGCPEMIVLDPHDNPVSNVTMQVRANTPFITNPEGVLFDTRPGLMVSIADPCAVAHPNYDEALGSCSAENFQNLQFKSSITRATFCTIMSGSPGGHYTFDVQADVKDDGSFDANLTYDIQAYFSDLQSNMGEMCNMGEYLDPHCVGKAGSTVRLSVKQHFIVRDQENQGEREDFCNGATNCPVLTKLDSYSTTRQVEERTILATPVGAPDAPVPVEYLDNGESVMLLDMPVIPGSYDYDWSSTASTPVERWGGTCDTCYAQPLPCFVNFYPNTSPYTPRHPLIKCHSVGFEFYKEPYLFNLDDYGYTTSDHDIEFQILPVDYQPDLPILEVFDEDGTDKVPVFHTSVNTGQSSVTIGQGTYFDITKRYFARIILNPSMPHEIKSTPVELSFYSASVNLRAFKPGTVIEPGEEITEYDEEDPEKLVMYVNSNRTPPTTGERDFNDDVIDPSDKDIVKLVLGRFLSEMPEGERIEFTLEPSRLFKIYNEDGIRLNESDLFDLTASIDPTLNILEHDVTLYIESLGPVYGAEASLSLIDPDGRQVVSDRVLLTAVFHTEDYHEAVGKAAKMAYKCIDPPGQTDDNLCNEFKSKWGFVGSGYVSQIVETHTSEYWKEQFESFIYLGKTRASTFIKLKEDASPHEGIKDFFSSPEKYAFECDNAIRVIENRAVLDLFERCNTPDDFTCLFSAGVSNSGKAYDKIFEGKTLAFANQSTNHIPGGAYINLFFNTVERPVFTIGSWIYLRNPSKQLLDSGDAHQGVNLIQLSAGQCQTCNGSLTKFFFYDSWHCPYDPDNSHGDPDHPSECLKNKSFFGHNPG